VVIPSAVIIGRLSVDAVPGGRALVNLAGNILDAETNLRGDRLPGACVEISGAGRCIVSHNHCTVAEGSTAAAIVRVDAQALIASANDLEGPGSMDALRVNTTNHTVLGNIATGPSLGANVGVDPKWTNLNA
jgi:hypothetical protein